MIHPNHSHPTAMQQEQPDLFGFSAPSAPSKPKPRASTPANTPTPAHTPAVKPYVPSLIPYAQWLAIFCGDKTLAYWYYSHQPEIQATA